MGCGSSSETAPSQPPGPMPAEANAANQEFLASYDELKVIEAFAKYDLDKNGSIDARELAVVLRNLGRTPTDEEISTYIKDADTDGSGVIEFKEFLPLCISLKLL